MVNLSKTQYKNIIKVLGVIAGAIAISINACNKDKISKPNPQLPIQVFFTPWDNAEQAIIDAIDSAKHSIYIQAYVWTSKPLTQAVLEARKRGVAIHVLCDKNQMMSSKSSQIPTLVKVGITVKLEVKYQSAHNKVIIIDYNTSNATLLTGSYNFSYSAQNKNAENLLVIRDAKLAKAYFDNWQRHSNDAIMY